MPHHLVEKQSSHIARILYTQNTFRHKQKYVQTFTSTAHKNKTQYTWFTPTLGLHPPKCHRPVTSIFIKIMQITNTVIHLLSQSWSPPRGAGLKYPHTIHQWDFYTIKIRPFYPHYTQQDIKRMFLSHM